MLGAGVAWLELRTARSSWRSIVATCQNEQQVAWTASAPPS
jgi:hypothetical protein